MKRSIFAGGSLYKTADKFIRVSSDLCFMPMVGKFKYSYHLHIYAFVKVSFMVENPTKLHNSKNNKESEYLNVVP